jgi:hypothetical protein
VRTRLLPLGADREPPRRDAVARLTQPGGLEAAIRERLSSPASTSGTPTISS